MAPSIGEGGSRRGRGGLALGPAQNTFGGPATDTRAAAEGLRDAYGAANPAWLALYDANLSFWIRLAWADGVAEQRRNAAGSGWEDVSGIVRGTPGHTGSQGGQGVYFERIYTVSETAPADPPAGGSIAAPGLLPSNLPAGWHAAGSVPDPEEGQEVYVAEARVDPVRDTFPLTPVWGYPEEAGSLDATLDAQAAAELAEARARAAQAAAAAAEAEARDAERKAEAAEASSATHAGEAAQAGATSTAAQMAAEAAREAAALAQADAEAARAASVAARNDADIDRQAAQTARNAAERYRDQAREARDAARGGGGGNGGGGGEQVPDDYLESVAVNANQTRLTITDDDGVATVYDPVDTRDTATGTYLQAKAAGVRNKLARVIKNNATGFGSDDDGKIIGVSDGGLAVVDAPEPKPGGDDGQTAAQVRTLIGEALDALVGDQATVVAVRAAGRDWTGSRTDDQATQTVVDTDSLLTVAEYILPTNIRTLAAGGEAFTLQLDILSAVTAQTGFDPDVQLVIQLSSDEGPYGGGVLVPLADGSLVHHDLVLPKEWLAMGDPDGDDNDLYVSITARVSIRSRSAAGNVRLIGASILARGTHDGELEAFVDRLIDMAVNPLAGRLDAEDRTLQDQVSRALQSLVTDLDRRILDLLSLVQDTSHVPYGVFVRDGTSGAFPAARATSFTPPSATFEVSLPADEARDVAGHLFARQDNDAGTPVDYLVSTHAHGSADNDFIYRFTLPNRNEVTFVRLTTADNLQVLRDVAYLRARAEQLDLHLSASALAMLGEVAQDTITTRAVARTSLLSALTVMRRTLTGTGAGGDQVPFSSPALSGGEAIVALRQDNVASGQSLLEAYLDDDTAIDLVKAADIAQGSTVLHRAVVPFLIPAQPARLANETVYLADANVPAATDEYRYDISRRRGAGNVVQEQTRLFRVPDSLAANTEVSLSLRVFENGNEETGQNHVFRVAVGGAQDGAAQVHDIRTIWRATVQYLILGGVRYIRLSIRAQTAANLVPFAWVLVSASHVVPRNIPAVPEGMGEQVVWAGPNFNSFDVLLGLRVDTSGNLVVIMEGGHAGFVQGEFNTHIPASRYGLQAGGTGVLRFHNTGWREMAVVTAGNLTAAGLETLRPHVDRHEYGMGLWSQADLDTQVFAFSRAIRAAAFYIGSHRIVTPSGQQSSTVPPSTSTTQYLRGNGAGGWVPQSGPLRFVRYATEADIPATVPVGIVAWAPE